MDERKSEAVTLAEVNEAQAKIIRDEWEKRHTGPMSPWDARITLLLAGGHKEGK